MHLFTSEIVDGNMHPSLEACVGEAQSNFTLFCMKHSIEPTSLLGLRIDPTWTDGDRILDLTQKGIDLQTHKRGSVAVEDRIRAHSIVFPKTIGAFALSADCYPVSIVSNTFAAFAHVGWRSARDNLIEQTIELLNGYTEKNEPYKVLVGPGIRFLSLLENSILSSIKRSVGNNRAVSLSTDRRDTFWSKSLYSRRNYISFATRYKPRGNHVTILS